MKKAFEKILERLEEERNEDFLDSEMNIGYKMCIDTAK